MTLAPIERRPRYQAAMPAEPVPRVRKVRYEASRLRTAVRLVHWLYLIIRMALTIGLDRLRGRRRPEDVAVRVREAFERAGGTFVKIGQQMGSRVDLLPYTLCQELGRLYDNMPSFPLAQALVRIERACGRPLAEVFARFDPQPIGSASIACVYQAELLTGEKVAVKVRRPRIGERFAEDLLALKWLAFVAEGLTLLRPGFTRTVRMDLQSMLMEETDLVSEARYQELFRRQASRDRIKFVTAPKVYPHLSNAEVLVQEFASGYFLSEILDAFEARDEAQLARFAEEGILPKRVARRLVRACYWSSFEALIFHADPHPANIIVQPGSQLVFIDFGACGTSSARARRTMLEAIRYVTLDDISSAARAAVRLLEPLQHIDVDYLVSRAEQAWWHYLYAIRSKHAAWWERTSAGLWLTLFEVTRELGLQVNLDTLRTLRASLLYDTLAARLWPTFDDSTFREYLEAQFRRRARRSMRRAEKESTRTRLARRVTQLDVLAETGEKLLSLVQNLTELSPNRFSQMANKASYATLNVLQASAWLVLPAIAIALGIAGLRLLRDGTRLPIIETALVIWAHPAYLAYAVGLVVLTLRRIRYRFLDSDHG